MSGSGLMTNVDLEACELSKVMRIPYRKNLRGEELLRDVSDIH